MKQLIRLAALPFIFIAANCCAQKANLPGRLSLVLSPALVSINGTQVAPQPGLQYEHGRWAAGAELAFLVHDPQRSYNIHYLRLGAELRHYLYTKPKTKDYVSLQVNYTWQSFSDSTRKFYYEEKNSHQVTYTSASVDAPIFVVAVKVGQEYRLSNKLFIDLFGGAGTRTTFTTYSHIVNRQEVINYGLRDWFTLPYRAYYYNQTLTRLHLTAGFRLGYVL